jgi:drug/metabolite transporter (DMT)-like permease
MPAREHAIVTASTSVHRRALAGLILATCFWSLSFPVVKGMILVHDELLPGAGNWFVTALIVGPRFALAAGLLLLWAPRLILGATTSELRQGLLLGLFNAGGMALQVDGLQFTSASVSAFLTQFSAILIPAVVALRTRRWPHPLVWLCASMVMAGVAILGRFDFHSLRLGRGEFETLLSTVFFMIQIFVLESPLFAGNRVQPVSAVMFGLEGVLFLGLALGTAVQPADCLVAWTSVPWILSTAVLTILCTLGAFMLMNHWQPKVTATEAGLIYSLESVFAALLTLFLPAYLSRWIGFDYPNEIVTWQMLVGGGLITLANVLLQLKPPVRA